jgi:hypothetical protein
MSKEINTQECAANINLAFQNCGAELTHFTAKSSQLPKDFFNDCFENDKCSPEKKEEGFKLVCPEFNKIKECFPQSSWQCTFNSAYQNEKTIVELHRFESACAHLASLEGTENQPQDCAAKVDLAFKNCGAELTDYTAKTSQLPKDFLNDCFENDKCSPEKKEEGFKSVCPEFKKIKECYKSAWDCTFDPAHQDKKTIQELHRFESACDHLASSEGSDSEYSDTDSVISQGFTFMMPWSLLLVFFV